MGFCKGTSGTPSLSFVLLDKSMLVHQQDIREWYHTCVPGAVINERYSIGHSLRAGTINDMGVWTPTKLSTLWFIW
ncbi:MAG: hypothetical protein ACK53Y_08235, partial [bacterium]